MLVSWLMSSTLQFFDEDYYLTLEDMILDAVFQSASVRHTCSVYELVHAPAYLLYAASSDALTSLRAIVTKTCPPP